MMMPRPAALLRTALVSLAFVIALPALAGEETLSPVDVVDTKAVYGRVETRDVVAARARIGGTLMELRVDEGTQVQAGDVIALVVDPKLAFQMQAVDGKIRALEAELANAKAELERANALIERGITTRQRVDALRTQVDVLTNQTTAARAERSVVMQQTTEGQVLAPASGRVLKVPVTRGAVLMPGESVATVAGGGFFLRLALPERHASLLKVGAPVNIGMDGSKKSIGKLAKVYPQIENGRVIADVSVDSLGDYFVGERILVQVPIATRQAITVPPTALVTRAGVDYVRITDGKTRREVSVVPGMMVDTAVGPRLEVLSGLGAGDVVVTP